MVMYQRGYLPIRIDSEIFRLKVILPWNTEIVALIAQAFFVQCEAHLDRRLGESRVIQNEHCRPLIAWEEKASVKLDPSYLDDLRPSRSFRRDDV